MYEPTDDEIEYADEIEAVSNLIKKMEKTMTNDQFEVTMQAMLISSVKKLVEYNFMPAQIVQETVSSINIALQQEIINSSKGVH